MFDRKFVNLDQKEVSEKVFVPEKGSKACLVDEKVGLQAALTRTFNVALVVVDKKGRARGVIDHRQNFVENGNVPLGLAEVVAIKDLVEKAQKAIGCIQAVQPVCLIA